VLNGSDRWVYNESADRVVYREASGYWISDTQTFGPETAVKLDAYEFTYEGTETVAGRRTHVVSMSPPADVLVELNVGVRDGENRRTLPLQRVTDEQLAVATETWWIDAEQPYPVQKRIEWANETGAVVMTTTRTYEELTVGVDHDPSTFRFEPPADAEVVERNHSDLRHFDTREAASAAVPFELPPVAPAMPSGYRFQGASIPEREDRTTVLLLFYDGTQSISVAVSDEPTPFGDGTVEENLGTVDGTLVATGRGQTFLTWRCGELTYRLSGPTETARLVELAEEIGCSAAASDQRVNQTRV
jgi:outer membrane lipoprotein-sorting protein